MEELGIPTRDEFFRLAILYALEGLKADAAMTWMAAMTAAVDSVRPKKPVEFFGVTI